MCCQPPASLPWPDILSTELIILIEREGLPGISIPNNTFSWRMARESITSICCERIPSGEIKLLTKYHSVAGPALSPGMNQILSILLAYGTNTMPYQSLILGPNFVRYNFRKPGRFGSSPCQARPHGGAGHGNIGDVA